MEQQDRESIDFEEIVQRTVNAEAKAGLRSSSMVRDSDIRCPRGHRPSNSVAAKVQTQGSKDSHPEEPKVKEVRPTRAEASEPSKQARKEKKKKRHQERQDKDQTLASTANATEVQKKKKKNRDQDVSKVTYFNCDKKGQCASTCTKPPKN